MPGCHVTCAVIHNLSASEKFIYFHSVHDFRGWLKIAQVQVTRSQIIFNFLLTIIKKLIIERFPQETKKNQIYLWFVASIKSLEASRKQPDTFLIFLDVK